MSIKPISPVIIENMKSSREKIKEEKDKIEKSISDSEVNKSKNKHIHFDR